MRSLRLPGTIGAVGTIDGLSGGTAATLWACWSQRADEGPDREAITHWTACESPFRWTRGELLAAATAHARGILERGVAPGDVCALILRHHRSLYPIYMAVSAIGALPSVLAYPNQRLHPEKFRAGLEGMAARSGLDWVLTHRELEPIVAPLLSRPGSTVRGLLFPLEWKDGAAGAPPSLGAARCDEPCLLQHSSGTTGLQKAVVLSHRAVLGHVRRYGAAIGAGPGDKVVSWLPLYHDMGLIACFQLPLALGLPLVQLDPFEWVRAPSILLEAVSRERGTLVWLPEGTIERAAASARPKKGRAAPVEARPAADLAPAIAKDASVGVGDVLAGTFVHVVRRGETLFRIAKRYGVSLAEIVGLNRLPENTTLHPGQRLFVPAPR